MPPVFDFLLQALLGVLIERADSKAVVLRFGNLITEKGEQVVLVERLVLLQRVHNLIDVGLLLAQLDVFGEVEGAGGADEGSLGVELVEGVLAEEGSDFLRLLLAVHIQMLTKL